MDFSDEWKSLWPICSSYSPPLLLSNSHEESSSKRRRIDSPIGPLIFNPREKTLKLLLHSPLLSTRLPPPVPDLSLPRFLQTSSEILFSTASSISTQFSPQVSDSIHNFNAIQFLPCPNFGENSKPTSILGISPTGENYDQVGFFMLCFEDNQFLVRKFKNGASFLVHNHMLNFRILRLLVNPVSEIDDDTCSSGYVTFGYLLVCTLYSVHWFSVKIGVKGVENVMLDYVGSADRNLFKGGAVSHACWSPHLREECVVLLENGDLFLFDMGSCGKSRGYIASDVLQGKKLRVLWDKLDRDELWLSCEFSWHPRILIVANSRTLFLVDLRSDKCKVCTLLKIEAVSLGRTDKFLALSRVESDPFCFAAVSGRVLLLCDVRKPLMPLLRWVHGLKNPSYVTVLRMSDVRQHTRDDKWAWATESGRCILVGSFWECEFALFCYGPGSSHCHKFPEILRLSKSVYAWGQPSSLSLSGRDCCCESCLMRADFPKDILPDWIDWRQKKVIVLGFGILNNGPSIQSDDTDSSAGFFLVRLMSCGSLEAQRYAAAWESEEKSESPCGGNSLCSENNLLYDMCVGEWEFKKKYNYLGLDFLKEYLNGNLIKILGRKYIENQKDSEENRSEFHQQICQKLKECGVARLRSSLTIFDVIKGVSLPASIYEIAIESISASLPNNLLGFAFSALLRFPELPLKPKKRSLEFSDIIDKLYPLPFPLNKCCINETPETVQSCSSSSAPVLPPPFLVALNNLQIAERDILPLDAEMRLQSDKVMEVAREIGLSHSGKEPDDGYSVSLDADTECPSDRMEKMKPLCLHEPVAFSDCYISKMDWEVEPDKRFTTFIYKKHEEPISNASKEMTRIELFDEGCPVELKFNDSLSTLGANELETFKILKQKDLGFQKKFQLYQEYLSGCHNWRQAKSTVRGIQCSPRTTTFKERTEFNATCELTRVLLHHDHGLNWWIPDGQLCSTVPNRSNCIHWIEDLLSSDIIPNVQADRNTAKDATDVALEWAEKNVKSNPHISELIEIRRVNMGNPAYSSEELNDEPGKDGQCTDAIFDNGKTVVIGPSPPSHLQIHSGIGKGYGGPPILVGVVKDGEKFDFCMCNPPFFETLEEAGLNPKTSCGGTVEEVACPGGESAFITRIIEDIVQLRQSFRWYTSMVGRKTNLKVVISKLWEVGATKVRTTEFVQGQTCRWGLAWSFLPASKKIVPSHVAEKKNMSFMLEGLQRHQSAFDVLQSVGSYFCSIGASSKLESASFKVDVTLSAEQCNSILTKNGNEQDILISANCPSDQLNDMHLLVTVF